MSWYEYGGETHTHIAINQWNQPEPLPTRGGTTIVLGVEDPHAVVVALCARGVRCDDMVEIPGMVRYGAFYDPDGNKIQCAG